MRRSGRLEGHSLSGREEFELVRLAGGAHSLRSLVTGQTFHPVIGPAAEAQAVHVRGSRLRERARLVRGLVIWDVGLGAAANALAAIEALEGASLEGAMVRLLSFDRDLGALEFSLAHADALACPPRHRQWMHDLRNDGRATIPLGASRVEWSFRRGDFPALLDAGSALPAPHAIFYDPYSPAVNPEMWTLPLFAALHARLRPEAPCLLTTYTRSTAARVTLLLAGFFVGLGPATGEKDQTTVASNDPVLLSAPLAGQWLDRVKASVNAAPLREPVYSRASITAADLARLRAHPQFA